MVIGEEVAVELGIWLSGLETFLAAGRHSFVDARDNLDGGIFLRNFVLSIRHSNGVRF